MRKNVYVEKNEADNNDDFVLFLLLCHDIERLEDTSPGGRTTLRE